MRSISADELQKKLDSSDDVTVINVLPQMYFEQKHIPGSINIPLEDLEDRAPSELNKKDAEIIVYCANTSCQASPNAASKLEEMGYTDVLDFEAGIEGWEEAGNKLEGNES